MQFNPNEKFDMGLKPPHPKRFLLPVEWIGSLFIAGPHSAPIKRVNCKGLKKPYLLLCNHASFRDFPMACRATFPHRAYWVISVEEFAGREYLMRGIGGIGKRKFTAQLDVVKNIMNCMKKEKSIVIMYPEARYSLVGINERLSEGLGKLAKTCGVPVVTLIEYGNFLHQPQWNKKPARKLISQAEMMQIVTAEEVKTLSADEIQKRIEDAFVFDDYAWQYENKIKITSKYRAHNIHRILYQCPACGKEFTMNSEYTDLWCEDCGARWTMDEYGRLSRTDGSDPVFVHVPDWYRWERANVTKEVDEGKYHFEDDVRLEVLASSRAQFVNLGTVRMTHNENGVTLKGTMEDGTDFMLNRPCITQPSMHIEYNFKERGDAIDVATLNDTYFVFPLNAKNPLTKLHFATEALFDKAKRETAENKKK